MSKTYGEAYGPAMEVRTQAEADEIFRSLVAETLKDATATGKGWTEQQAIECVKSNLGYYAGYYNTETRSRVESLFQCSHPVFGAIATNGPPSDPFQMGIEMGKKFKGGVDGA